MVPFPATGPVNLTEAADRMPWSEVDKALRVCAFAGEAVLEIRGLSDAEDGYRHDGLCDFTYVIVTGYGVLRTADTRLEFTAGDVLFVPRGFPHSLERLDGDIRLWRISLAAVFSPDGG
ncbi:MAG: hypothetical protein JWR10_927 [Rubritepida sp.]|nr:hypothetical protein [Rubritepida sp.]